MSCSCARSLMLEGKLSKSIRFRIRCFRESKPPRSSGILLERTTLGSFGSKALVLLPPRIQGIPESSPLVLLSPGVSGGVPLVALLLPRTDMPDARSLVLVASSPLVLLASCN
ncbi:hypothetical protein K2173_007198 [Erythroxylum novogranatense]|uniref:Uncharacterized protein n=1 Tax=Erythroxylum novogranatense TaxID=1862640 RepID=A0AAV8SZZ2_9ROSI|nr:hypothetical protein K2173_007198 [Erythroxylum novogranatense]